MEAYVDIKYPNVKSVALAGEDGNAFAIMSRVGAAMRRAGLSKSDIKEFQAECMSGDYDNLLRTVVATVPTHSTYVDEDEQEFMDWASDES
jgi:hypothetical protein